MKHTLYVATTNRGKLRDFEAAADLFNVGIEPLPQPAGWAPPEEDGESFYENAVIKAVFASKFLPSRYVLADDSGLEVDGLNGRPGVKSARFAMDAGMPAEKFSPAEIDRANNRLLLEELNKVSGAPRTARYRCVLALAKDGILLETAVGSVEGKMLTQPRGDGGFGYDPLFYLPELGVTMAEIDLVTKQSLSHRGRALQQLLEKFVFR